MVAFGSSPSNEKIGLAWNARSEACWLTCTVGDNYQLKNAVANSPRRIWHLSADHLLVLFAIAALRTRFFQTGNMCLATRLFATLTDTHFSQSFSLLFIYPGGRRKAALVSTCVHSVVVLPSKCSMCALDRVACHHPQNASSDAVCFSGS